MTPKHETWDPPATGGKTFPKHPEGSYRIVLVDALRLGLAVKTFGKDTKLVDKVVLLFQSEELQEDGRAFELAAEFTYSASDKATLPKFLGKWLGLSTASDVDRGKLVSEIPAYIGRSGIGTVTQNAVGDKVYVNLTAVAPLMKGMAKLAPTTDYTRNEYWAKKKDRYAEEVAAYLKAAEAKAEAPPTDFDDVPGPLDKSNENDLPF